MKNYFFLFLFFLFTTCFGQNHNIKFSHILPENGLSHSFVSKVIQDKNGFLWFGTKDGLNKYDGYTFTIYKNDPDNLQSLSHNFIQDLIFDKDGNLWVGSWGGLSKFDTEREIFQQFKQNDKDPNSIPNDLISSLLEDHKGNLWLGTEAGLIKYDKKSNRFTSYRHNKHDPESISDDYVRDVFLDEKKQLWIGTYHGGLNLFNYETGKFKRYLHDENNPSSIGDNCAYNIFQDSKHRMWIGTHKNGFDMFDRTTEKFTHFTHDPNNPNSVIHNVVTCFEEDSFGYLWIGTENGGLSIFNPETGEFKNFQHDDIDKTTLGNNSLYSILKDVKGNMWIGTYSGGINFLSLEASKFHHYKHSSSPNSLSNNNVLCFFEDSKSNLWIGTDGGGANLYDRKTKTFTSFKNDPKNKNSIAGDYVLSISEDEDHQIWFGTWGEGVSVYNPEKRTFKHFRNIPSDSTSLNGNNAWFVYNCKKNKMWVGTYRGEGLDLYDKNNDAFISFSNDPLDSTSLNNDYINYIYEDRKGNFWIGTGGGGINLFDKKTNTFSAFKRDNDKNSLTSNNVDCIFEDSQGRLWLGTDLGLNLMDPVTKRFTNFTTKDGLPDDVIFGILEDSKGYLWISTTKGLSKFNIAKKTFTNYTIADGLQSQEFKPHAFYKDKSGTMYFGGINGFNEFYPDSLTEVELQSPLYITDFKIFHKSVAVGDTLGGEVILTKSLSYTKQITLSHDQSFFSIEFASLNYTVPEKNQYAYMLQGFDKDWNYIGSRRLATYTDIPPGTYTFRVKASHNNGSWKEKETDLIITITPPFWNTWWFKTICVLGIISAFVTFFSVRMKAIRSQKEALEREVKARTLDLRAAAKKIESQRDSLKSANEHVMSSINYANSIQKAILSTKEKIEATVAEHFIIYKPKDVVSGDFYWFSHLPLTDINPFGLTDGVKVDQNFIAAVDCTGHGVSGAFMSIIGNTLFNEIIDQKHIFDPAEILEALDKGLKISITPSDGVNIAGMDVCLCKIENLNEKEVKVSFAGARRPLYYVRKGSMVAEKINGDIISIGSDFKEGNYFITHELILEKGSLLYLTTDGYADQNNPSKQKIGSAQLKKLIEAHCHMNMADQKRAFEETLKEHQLDAEQRDDITIIGVRV